MSKTTRIEEIQRMFQEMGLGTPEDRERFLGLSRPSVTPTEETPGEEQQEQVFIRLENTTSAADEVRCG